MQPYVITHKKTGKRYIVLSHVNHNIFLANLDNDKDLIFIDREEWKSEYQFKKIYEEF